MCSLALSIMGDAVLGVYCTGVQDCSKAKQGYTVCLLHCAALDCWGLYCVVIVHLYPFNSGLGDYIISSRQWPTTSSTVVVDIIVSISDLELSTEVDRETPNPRCSIETTGILSM